MVAQQKIVLIGAGSLQFGLGAVGSILESEMLTGSTISLHDINQTSLDLVTQACQSVIDQKKLDFTIESSINRAEALKNANFVINSIEVAPRFDLWDQDYQIPHDLGNKQVFGENGGPGGLFHSARVIPPILEICEDIQKICPTAFFFNFSNPMSRICLAIKRKYPDLKTIGLCHEIQFAEHNLPLILDQPLSNLVIRAGGLNHFGVIMDVKYRDSGKDAYPDLLKKAPSFLETMVEVDGTKLTQYILNQYKILPYTTDSHFGEYIPWAWEVADLEGIKQFKDTYMETVLSSGRKIKRLIKKGKEDRLVKPDGERVIPIIEGILGDKKYEEISVNLPNEGIITNIPQDLVVECPALVDRHGVHGITLGDLPRPFAALTRTQASVQDLVVEAILQNSKDLAFQALLADPVVDGPAQAQMILDKMLIVQAQYLHFT